MLVANFVCGIRCVVFSCKFSILLVAGTCQQLRNDTQYGFGMGYNSMLRICDQPQMGFPQQRLHRAGICEGDHLLLLLPNCNGRCGLGVHVRVRHPAVLQ